MEASQPLQFLPLLIKLFILTGLILYAVFAGIILRQEQLMSRVFEGASEPLIRALAFMHLIAAVAVFLLGVILL